MNKTLEHLLLEVNKIKDKIGKEVRKKLNEFKKNLLKDEDDIYLELCFCILVANTSLNKTLEIWKNIKEDLLNDDCDSLVNKLKELGYRFYRVRAKYIIEARKYKRKIKELLGKINEKDLREWLVKNVKGIGWKEASHFLRNMGYENFAILDRHILRILKEYKIVEDIPKSLTKKRYLEIEEKLREIAEKLGISLAELDMYLFFMETGKIPER